MLEVIALFAALSRWLTFGPEPIPEQLAEGRQLHARGKGIERTLKDSRAVIGVWFDGRIKDDVESIIWISPGMASRWLGYLQAQEKWPYSEVQKRWERLRESVDGKLCFVVRLSAMPKLCGIDMESSGRPSATEVDKVSFRLTSGPGYDFPRFPLVDKVLKTVSRPTYLVTLKPENPLADPAEPVTVRTLARWQARNRAKLETYRWYQDLPLKELFGSSNEEFASDPGYGLGDYISAWYWVVFPSTPWRYCAGGFEVWVVSPNKQRVGSFRLSL